MATWSDFAGSAPELAASGRRVLERSGTGEAFLATVRLDAPPRIHPINIAVVDGHPYAFVIVGSSTQADLDLDERYPLHGHQDPARPDEFLVRGRAEEVAHPTVRAMVGAAWSFEVDDGYRLFEFSIDHAVFGARADADAWPARYTSWRSAAAE